jgi:hypothetical protein
VCTVQVPLWKMGAAPPTSCQPRRVVRANPGVHFVPAPAVYFVYFVPVSAVYFVPAPSCTSYQPRRVLRASLRRVLCASPAAYFLPSAV